MHKKLILLREMLGNDPHDIPLTSVETTDTFLLFYKKFHFCHLLPFAKVGQCIKHHGDHGCYAAAAADDDGDDNDDDNGDDYDDDDNR